MNIIQEIITGNKSSDEIIKLAKANMADLNEDDIYNLVHLNMLNNDDLRNCNQVLSEDIHLRLINNFNAILNGEKEDVKGLDFIKKELSNVKKNDNVYYFFNTNKKESGSLPDYVSTLGKDVFTENVMLLCISLLKGGITNNMLEVKVSSELLLNLIENELVNRYVVKMEITKEVIKETCKKMLSSEKFNYYHFIKIIEVSKEKGVVSNEMLEVFEEMQYKLLSKIKEKNTEEERMIIKVFAEYLIADIFNKDIANKYKDKVLQVLKIKNLFLSEEGIEYEDFQQDYYSNKIIIENENDYKYFEKLLQIELNFYKFLKEDKTGSFYSYIEKILDNESEKTEDLFLSLFRNNMMEAFLQDEEVLTFENEKMILLLTKERIMKNLTFEQLKNGCSCKFNVKFLNFLNDENAQKMNFKGMEDFYTFFIDNYIFSNGEEHFEKWTTAENIKRLINNQIIPSIMKKNNSMSDDFVSRIKIFENEELYGKILSYKGIRELNSDKSVVLNELLNNSDMSKLLILDEFNLFGYYGFKLDKEDNWLNNISEKIKKIKYTYLIEKEDVNNFFNEPLILNSYITQPDGVEAIVLMSLEIKKIDEQVFINTMKFLKEKRIEDDYILNILMKKNRDFKGALIMRNESLEDLDYLKKIFSLDFLYSKECRDIIIKRIVEDNIKIRKQDFLNEIIIKSKDDEDLIMPMCKLYDKEDLVGSTIVEHIINGKRINKILMENMENDSWVKSNLESILVIAIKKDMSELLLSSNFKKVLFNSYMFNSDNYKNKEITKNFLLNGLNNHKFIEEYIEHVKLTGKRNLNNNQMYEIFNMKDILNTEKVIEFMNIIAGTRKDDISKLPEWLPLNKELRMILKEVYNTSSIELIMSKFSSNEVSLEDRIIIKYEEIEMKKEIKSSSFPKNKKKIKF